MAAKLLYHGSLTGGITKFELRKEHTPGSFGDEAPHAVYAGKTAAYAAAHAWPWSSPEGVDVVLKGKTLTLKVPAGLEERLKQKVYIYSMPADEFAPLNTDPKGYNFWTHNEVEPLACKEYESVTKAVEANGGKVVIIPAAE